MAWVSVHQSVDCIKLRTLKRQIGLSKAETLGVLTALWMWGLDNCAEDGEIKDADLSDIEGVIRGWVNPTVDVAATVAAIVATGWIDTVDGKLYFHDWDMWQKQWYDSLKERKRKANYQREIRKNAVNTAVDDGDENSSGNSSGNSSDENSGNEVRSPSPNRHLTVTLPESKKERTVADGGTSPPRQKKFVPPTVEEVAAYCLERKNNIDPQRFVDSYEVTGWVPKGSKVPMKSWKAAVRTWEGNERARAPKPAGKTVSAMYPRLE